MRKDTSTQKLLDERGWEILHDRQYRRLCYFFSLPNPELQITSSKKFLSNGLLSDLRSTHNYGQNLSRTKRYSDSYFNNTLYEWNQLHRTVEESPSIAVFKSNLLQVIRPVRNPVSNILTYQVRVNFSSINEHRFRHNFEY